VIPELLDELPPDDPRAVHSRGDLRRVNKLMGNADIVAGAVGACEIGTKDDDDAKASGSEGG